MPARSVVKRLQHIENIRQKNKMAVRDYVISRNIMPEERVFSQLNDLVMYLKCGIGLRVDDKSSKVVDVITREDCGSTYVSLKFHNGRDVFIVYPETNVFLFWPQPNRMRPGSASEDLTAFCFKIDERISKMRHDELGIQ
jgi:hypothetical protein